jgi:hypothetical protein
MRRFRPVPFLVLVFLLWNCNSNAPDEPGLENREVHCQDVIPSPLALWSEFLDRSAVTEQIDTLKTHGLSLFQNITSVEVARRDAKAANLFHQASCQGLEVRAWLTLPEQDGYWPNELNVDLFAEKVYDLANWIREAGWPIEWIVVDMEPDLDFLNALMEKLEQGDILGAIGLFIESHDPERYAQSKGKFTRMVEALQEMDFKVMVVTFPMVLDDLVDGDSSIQDALNTPVDGIPWDELSFMAYTTVFERFIPNDITPFLIKSYGRDALAAYGDKAALDLGVLGQGGITGGEGITEIQEFLAQVGVAKFVGLSRIHAYSLDGILGMENPEPWFEAFQTTPRDIGDQFTVNLLRGIIQLLDDLIQDPPASS